MKLEFDDLPGWEFDVEEVSAGVYRVTGRDHRGHQRELAGEDPEALLDACKSAVRELIAHRNGFRGTET